MDRTPHAPVPAPGRGSPTDWTTGERVFAPPAGTLDVAWLVPAVLEAAPGTTPAVALAALEASWSRLRAAGPVDPSAGARPGDPVAAAAEDVVREAVRQFAVHPAPSAATPPPPA
ncbi:hypothetical protein [Cellulomonas endophytica]|uniref:hypothetical protein n=1 Tax=Cellulomonas endophytica TaxID=2494735 RepID=UPI001013ACC9|nr:hypothetical protein [Cellulomonas endophytica]